MYQVKFTQNKEIIERIISLRYEVLRKPWNKPADTATDELEYESINAYIELNDKIIACARLQDNGNGLGQIRFMAVSQTQQGKGLGKQIVLAIEEEAKKMGLEKIQLQARDNAVEFYKSCGYTIKEKTFLMWDLIQHFLMDKTI